ncbi:neuronal acetylcholine receptor subunit beta-3-like [Ylistrum balloti]|uniref:neuronal acetylcholine receptor subunit beta-3-like n=1 Tax=Ylistrum balloti TaxID=509963 RepID=UPI002905DC29|nr:neuronal acetylcholine receptor subunit beta-3-like [Ylistrum balloti]
MTSVGAILTSFLLALMTKEIVPSPSLENVKNIYKHIFDGYDQRIRPVLNQSDPLLVEMSFFLSSINEFDEKSQKLVIAGWFIIQWTDEVLNWNTSEFGNISQVHIDGNSIWLPSIALVNTFGRINMLSQSSTNAVVHADGKVKWFPADSFVVTCEVDITYYPFDTQECSLVFEIWNSPSSEVALVATSKSFDISSFKENVEWSIVKSEVQNRERDYGVSISFIDYFFHLQRRPKFVVLTIIAPVILLAFLNICVFLIPLSSGERNSFCVTVYLSYAVFLGLITAELPHNSKNVSYLTMYLLALLVFSVVIVLITVIQIRLFLENGETIVPAFFSKMFGFNTRGTQCQVKPLDIDDSEDNDADILEDREEKKRNRNEKYIYLREMLPRFDVPLFFGALVARSLEEMG